MHCIDKKPKTEGKNNAIKRRQPLAYTMKHVIMGYIPQQKEIALVSL